MGKNYHAEFKFLGHRKYVHGPSLTHGLTEALDAWGVISVSRIAGAYHEMLHNNGTYCLFSTKQEQLDSGKRFVSSFVVETNQEKMYVGLEDSGDVVSGSVPYDEDALIDSCEIDVDKRHANVICKHEFHMLNILVALTKRLHLTVLTREGYTQWYFAGYDLRWPQMINRGSEDRLSVDMKSVFNNIYTRSTVTINGTVIGYILFAREVVQ